jgi:uncharacterized Zn finger protein (UPF0148 family)
MAEKMIKKCAVCGNEFEAYNDKTPCPNCVHERKMRESRYDSDRAKLERLYAEMQSISQNGGSDEAYYAKKKEYQDWKSYMLREYGTTHANGI